MQRQFALDTLSDLIGAIYDCVLEPARWERTLGLVREAIDCCNAILALQAMPGGELLLHVTSNVSPDYLARLPLYAADTIDQWGGVDAISSHPFEEPAVLSWFRPRGLWQNNPLFAEWGTPQGIVDIVGLTVARDAATWGTLGLGRHESAGPVTPADIDILRLLAPHIQRAVAISRVLDIKDIVARNFESALDAVAAGIILVGSRLEIVHANAAGEAMLAAGAPVASAGGCLTAPYRSAQQALKQAVASAGRDESQIGRQGFGIPLRPEHHGPFLVHVLPLNRGSLRRNLLPRAVAAIFVSPAGPTQPPPERALAALFDLTAAESGVFTSIGSGRTLAETAATLGITVSTAKTHLHRIFGKTGVRRQAELVKLATSLTLAGPVEHPRWKDRGSSPSPGP